VGVGEKREMILPDPAPTARSRRIYEIEALAEGDTEVFLLGERGKFPPFVSTAVKPRRSTRFSIRAKPASARRTLVSKITDVRIGRGQRVRLETPGGGGFGDPLTRDPARVRATQRSGTYRGRRHRAIMASCSAMTAASTGRRRRFCAARPAHECRRVHCRRRRRRHVYRSVLVRRGGAGVPRPKVPSQRGDEAAGFLQGLLALGDGRKFQFDRARHNGRHQYAAGTTRPRIGRHHHTRFRDVLKCAAATGGRPWGLWGEFIPIADRDLRLEVEERHARGRQHPHAGSMRRRSQQRR